MMTNLEKILSHAESENRFLSNNELQEIIAQWQQTIAQTVTDAESLRDRASTLIEEATAAVAKEFPEYETHPNREKCKKAIADYLYLIQHCLVSPRPYPIEGITYNFFLFPEQAIVALNYLKSHHNLTAYAKVTANDYIDRAIATFAEIIKNAPPQKELVFDPDAEPFWKRLVEIGKQVPQEEWDKFPKDFSRNLEHYMYGAPKEE